MDFMKRAGLSKADFIGCNPNDRAWILIISTGHFSTTFGVPPTVLFVQLVHVECHVRFHYLKTVNRLPFGKSNHRIANIVIRFIY